MTNLYATIKGHIIKIDEIKIASNLEGYNFATIQGLLYVTGMIKITLTNDYVIEISFKDDKERNKEFTKLSKYAGEI